MNLKSALSYEISRLARREVTASLKALRRLVTQHRHLIATLRRKVNGLEKDLAKTRRQGARLTRSVAAPDAKPATKGRFSGVRLRAFRAKMGLSATDVALLIGMSSASVYLWETQPGLRPAPETVAALAALRRRSKSELEAMLEAKRKSGTGKKRGSPAAGKRGARKGKRA